MSILMLTSVTSGQPVAVVADHVTHVEPARGGQADVYLTSGAMVRVTESIDAVQQMLLGPGQISIKDEVPQPGENPGSPTRREKK